MSELSDLWERWGVLMGEYAGGRITREQMAELHRVRKKLGLPLENAAGALVARLAGATPSTDTET